MSSRPAAALCVFVVAESRQRRVSEHLKRLSAAASCMQCAAMSERERAASVQASEFAQTCQTPGES